MIDDFRPELGQLLHRGVPAPMVEELESLLLELDGALVAEGWSQPDGQARFVAQRLERYALKFRELADG